MLWGLRLRCQGVADGMLTVYCRRACWQGVAWGAGVSGAASLHEINVLRQAAAGEGRGAGGVAGTADMTGVKWKEEGRGRRRKGRKEVGGAKRSKEIENNKTNIYKEEEAERKLKRRRLKNGRKTTAGCKTRPRDVKNSVSIQRVDGREDYTEPEPKEEEEEGKGG